MSKNGDTQHASELQKSIPKALVFNKLEDGERHLSSESLQYLEFNGQTMRERVLWQEWLLNYQRSETCLLNLRTRHLSI